MVVLSPSCVWLLQPHRRSSPGASIHGICQARILESAAISFSRRSSWPRDQALIFCVSFIDGQFFTSWATRKALMIALLKSRWVWNVKTNKYLRKSQPQPWVRFLAINLTRTHRQKAYCAFESHNENKYPPKMWYVSLIIPWNSNFN